MFDRWLEGGGAAGAESTSYPARMGVSARSVAAELRAREPGIGRLKLHKLLYYCQGHHLATFGVPLFEETVSAWDKGPVVGRLWHSENVDEVEVEGDRPGEAELNTIGYVISRYGALSGRDLMHLTHSEDPWRRADVERRSRESKPIAQAWMREYFSRESDDDDDTVLDTAAVKAWLKDAEAGLDEPAQRDDPAEIAARLEDQRSRARASR